MKTKRYTLAVVVVLVMTSIFSANIFAQPGHSRGRGHAYGNNRNNSRGYYPVRYSPVRYSPVRYSPVRYSPVRYTPVRYYAPRYYPSRVYYSGRPSVSISFGGIGYRYQSGYYYRPYGTSFRFVLPPFGVRISSLPMGYRRVYVGPSPYYYYGGVYYRPYGRQYEVVKPPLGAIVRDLPPGAKVTVIDGRKYYELGGTYYEESITSGNDVEYRVVGTDGVLNTTPGPSDENDRIDDNEPGINDEPINHESVNNDPVIGDKYEDLPAHSKSVVVNGEKLYKSPSGKYYKKVVEGDRVYYEVVGI